MKCADPNCNRSGWFSKWLFCSGKYRDSFAGEGPKRSRQERTPRSTSNGSSDSRPRSGGLLAAIRIRTR